MLKRVSEVLKKRNGEIHDENQYLNLIEDVLKYGEEVKGRNGITKTIFGASMIFDLSNGYIPFLTTKQLAWKTCAKELFWFIKGSTDNVELQNNNVKIWNGNSSRDYLDSIGLTEREENDLGPVYGFQWRFFNAYYETCKHDYSGKGIDQLNEIIENLKHPENRYSRRLILTAWNPNQLKLMALPPCHLLAQFNVIGNKLSCSMYQRSADLGLGVPFNIASYSLLTILLAHHCNLELGDFVYNLGNVHIYDDHYEELTKQIERKPYLLPKIKIKNKYDNINNYSLEDIEIDNYKFHEKIVMEMRK